MDVVLKVLGVFYLLVLALQLRGYLAHRGTGLFAPAAPRQGEFLEIEGEASFS